MALSQPDVVRSTARCNWAASSALSVAATSWSCSAASARGIGYFLAALVNHRAGDGAAHVGFLFIASLALGFFCGYQSCSTPVRQLYPPAIRATGVGRGFASAQRRDLEPEPRRLLLALNWQPSGLFPARGERHSAHRRRPLRAAPHRRRSACWRWRRRRDFVYARPRRRIEIRKWRAEMALQFDGCDRPDKSGKAIVTIDEPARTSMSGRPGALASVVWTTEGLPVATTAAPTTPAQGGTPRRSGPLPPSSVQPGWSARMASTDNRSPSSWPRR